MRRRQPHCAKGLFGMARGLQPVVVVNPGLAHHLRIASKAAITVETETNHGHQPVNVHTRRWVPVRLQLADHGGGDAGLLLRTGAIACLPAIAGGIGGSVEEIRAY